MVACLEKTEGNSDFHEIVDFLASSSIHHALTVSPPIYTSYIEQFWNTASSQTVNDVKQINATVDSKAVVVTEASIRSSLLFNDVDGTACLTNEAIFQNLALIAEGESSGGHTFDRAEGALNLQELSILCTNLSNRVLTLESIKDAQAAEISALKSRIKKLEKNSETGEVKLTDDTKVVEEKSNGNKGGNVEELVSTARLDIDAAKQEDSTVEPRTPPTTTSIFDDEDITMAQTLIKMKEEKAKEKGVSIKDVDDSSRPARSILTLKPLLTIDPKDKGKGVLKESPVKKVKRSDLDAVPIAKDVEIARLVYEKELAEMEGK
ncbi:hypothetical protein Tco_1238425 [Tanacetum coccineum]